jgi:enoyl-[acyl-carrier-protein] reductase (NADH)
LSHGEKFGTDEGQARSDYRRRRQPIDCLGIAKACPAAGAEIALTRQGDALKKRVEPLAAELGGLLLGHYDVTDAATIDAVFDVLKQQWGKIDFVVHAIVFRTRINSTAATLKPRQTTSPRPC